MGQLQSVLFYKRLKIKLAKSKKYVIIMIIIIVI